MKTLFSYNFDTRDLKNLDFNKLYQHNRRDAIFAHAFSHQGKTYALRDHLGTIPLYYRFSGRSIKFSTNLSALVKPGDTLDPYGVRTFLAFGTAKLYPLIKEIGIVPPGSVLKLNPKTKNKETVYSYRFMPTSPRLFRSKNHLKLEYQQLFTQAINRQIQTDNAALYLSGGADSAIIALRLAQENIKVHSFTSAPYGLKHHEIDFARKNANIARVHTHQVITLDRTIFSQFPQSFNQTYSTPHASSTALGVASIWSKSDIGKYDQVWFGQNCDTMFGSMYSQNDTWILSYLPKFIRRRLSLKQRFSNLSSNYTSYISKGYLTNPQSLIRPLQSKLSHLSRFQRLIALGMYIGHTPADSEVLSMPVYHHHHVIANPYYDMDLIEWVVGLNPFWSLEINSKHNTRIGINKKIAIQATSDYLPLEVVQRKKAFLVNLQRSTFGQNLSHRLLSQYLGIDLIDEDSQLAATVLDHWINQHQLTIN